MSAGLVARGGHCLPHPGPHSVGEAPGPGPGHCPPHPGCSQHRALGAVSLSLGRSLTAAGRRQSPADLLVTHGPPSLFSQGGPRPRSGFRTVDLAKRSAAAVWGHSGHRVLLGDGLPVPPDVLLHADAPQRAGPARGYVAALRPHASCWAPRPAGERVPDDSRPHGASGQDGPCWEALSVLGWVEVPLGGFRSWGRWAARSGRSVGAPGGPEGPQGGQGRRGFGARGSRYGPGGWMQPPGPRVCDGRAAPA